MLKQPFSDKELFVFYTSRMSPLNDAETVEELWEVAGKTKKTAWRELAKMINERMQAEAADAVLAHIERK